MEDALEEGGVGHPVLGAVAREVFDPRADVHRARRLERLDVSDPGQLLGEQAVAPVTVVFRRFRGCRRTKP